MGLLAVEPVLDGEAKPAGEELGDLGPAVPENQLRLVKDIVLDLAPLPLLGVVLRRAKRRVRTSTKWY